MIRWSRLTSDFYPPPTRLADRFRSGASAAALRAFVAREALLDRLNFSTDFPPGVHFIYLHHVFDDEVEPFRKLLVQLSRRVTFVAHSEAVRRIVTGDIDRTFVSFSFDDGLKTCIEAARLLKDAGTTGCFFVCPGVVNRAADDRWVADWCRSALHKNPAELMSWNDIERLQDAGHEIGNHTLNHVNLAAVTDAMRVAEIAESREILVRRLGPAAGRHFAWPYGEAKHISAAALQDIRDSGHETCASAIRGVHAPRSHVLRGQVPATSSIDPILARNHAVFTRPIGATELFMRRNVRRSELSFRGTRA